MAGIFHAYYTVALAPAIAALVGIGAAVLWQRRGLVGSRIVLAATLAGTVFWAWVLLGRSAEYCPWLKWLVLVAGLVAAVGLLVADRVGRAIAATLVAVGLLAALGAPAAYALDTAGTAHTGSIPSAGPGVTSVGFGGMGAPGGMRPGRGLPNAATAPGGTLNGFPGGGVLPGIPEARPAVPGVPSAAARPAGCCRRPR